MFTNKLSIHRCLKTFVLFAALFTTTQSLAEAQLPYRLLLVSNEGEMRSRHHEFDHQLRYPTRQFQDPMSTAWHSAKMGALIGLGAAAAISLIDFSIGGDVSYAGRLMAGLTGLGFLTGGTYGYVSAVNNNRSLERREDQLMRQFGQTQRFSLQPILTATQQNIGGGLTATLRF